MAIKLICFDLDDTLWDCAPVIANAEQAFYDWLSQQHARIAECYTQADLVEHRREHFANFTDSRHDLSIMRKSWLSELARQWGLDDTFAEQGFGVFWRARNDVDLYPGVLETLQQLGKRYALASITNGNADVHYIGIGEYFDAVVTAADAGCSKPAKEIFQYTLERLEIEPHEAVHVGDDPVNDVLGAAAHGMRTIWINPHSSEWLHEQAPDAHLHSVQDIASVLEEW